MDLFKFLFGRGRHSCEAYKKQLHLSKTQKTHHASMLERFDGIQEYSETILDRFERLEKAISTVDNRQKEMIIQLDEIDTCINESPEVLFASLMAVADIVYDFYCFSKHNQAIGPQAEMMWQGAVTALKKADITVLVPNGEIINYNLHIAHGTTNDPYIPHECIKDTLKCGYINEDKILRRATVMVNKLDTKGSEPNIFAENVRNINEEKNHDTEE